MSSVHTSISKSAAVTSSASKTATGWLSTLTALTFGALLLYAVGFSPMEVAHNAAHDTRHSLAFPCH